MRKDFKIIIIAVAVLLVGGGTIFGTIIFLTWGEYNFSDTYIYDPGVPSPIEDVSFSCDVGAISIHYNTTPTDNVVKIDLTISVNGGFVEGKTFSDFFQPIIWENVSVPVINFELHNKPTAIFIFGLFRNIQIDVTLRTDVGYNIDAYTATGSVNLDASTGVVLNDTSLSSSTGSVALNADEDASFLGDTYLGTSTGSVSIFADNNTFSNGIYASSSTGSATLNFTNCIMGDDLYCSVSTGSIGLKSYNMLYTQDAGWNVGTSTGSVDVEIYQSLNMGANVIGTIGSSTGGVDIVYTDKLSTVGAEFDCGTGTGSVTYMSSGSGGFSWIGDSNDKVITSDDYGASTFRYTFTVSTSTGSIEVIGESL
ncbi:MAG: hypothetical protein ACXAES_09480 [Promethearchaeota archaeon]|jgi:hypothetical protein